MEEGVLSSCSNDLKSTVVLVSTRGEAPELVHGFASKRRAPCTRLICSSLSF